MVSPWPPSTKAVTSSTETSNSSARNSRKRALSSTPAMPTTRLAGKPVTSCISPTMASSGLVMTMTKALGACCLMPWPTLPILGVDADQVVARHAGLARHARGHDHHVGAFDVLVARGARVGRIEALDRRELGDIERLALGRALGLRD